MKFSFGRYFAVILLLLFIAGQRVTSYQKHSGGTRNDNQIIETQIKHILKSIQQRYAPDLHLAVFNISCIQVVTGIIIRGEVDNPDAKSAAIHAIQRIVNGEVIDSIHALPDSALGNDTTGIIILSVANVRRKPGKQEELLTQVLMGTVVKLLKKERGYFFIQTPDRYLGWLDIASMYITNRAGVNDMECRI